MRTTAIRSRACRRRTTWTYCARVGTLSRNSTSRAPGGLLRAKKSLELLMSLTHMTHTTHTAHTTHTCLLYCVNRRPTFERVCEKLSAIQEQLAPATLAAYGDQRARGNRGTCAVCAVCVCVVRADGVCRVLCVVRADGVCAQRASPPRSCRLWNRSARPASPSLTSPRCARIPFILSRQLVWFDFDFY
jgi:hypothetical protein